MKISSSEFGKSLGVASEGRILPEKKIKWSERKNIKEKCTTPLERGMNVAQEAIEEVPEIREDIVNELKDKIKNGQYNVSGDDIADMMLRRLGADKIR